MLQVKKNTKTITLQSLYEMNIKTLWQALKNEHMSFWFLCFYFFFEYVHPQVLYPVIDILPWSQTFLILICVSIFSDNPRSRIWAKHPINKWLILFCFITLLSGIFAFDPSVSWKYKNVLLTWLIIHFMLINIINTEKRLFLFIIAYLLFSLKMAQFGAYTWAMRGFSFAGFGLVGSPGWFRNSGEFAIQMLIYGSLALSVVLSLKQYWGRYKKWILFIAAGTGYMAVMGASSRGAQIGLAAIVIRMMLTQKGGLKGLIIIVSLSAILYNILPDAQMKRFSEMGADDSSLQRFAYWEAGIETVKEHPFLGVGYYSWVDYMWNKFPEGIGVAKTIQVCHNIYIQAASEMGIPGLMVFLILIILTFRTLIQTRKLTKNSEDKFIYFLTYGLEAGLIGFLVAGNFVTVLFYPFFWIQMSMIVSVYMIADKKNREQMVGVDSIGK